MAFPLTPNSVVNFLTLSDVSPPSFPSQCVITEIRTAIETKCNVAYYFSEFVLLHRFDHCVYCEKDLMVFLGDYRFFGARSTA
jgi:hypothetical protein